MMLSAIGLPTDRSGVYGQVQDWLQAHGLGVYVPQVRHGESTNIGGPEWDAATEGLRWKPATIQMMTGLRAPMVFAYGNYWYNTNPRVLNWDGRDQDECTPAELAGYLAHTYAWLLDRGVSGAWILVDEPPHHPTYGWTQEIESRVVKFVEAAQTAGFGVGVAMPGPTQLRFWQGRLTPDWWIVNDKHGAPVWRPLLGTADCWLYNAATFAGLGKRLREVRAFGYLHWSGVQTTKTNPLPVMFTVREDGFAVNEAAWDLVDELTADHGPQTWQEGYAMLDARLKAGGL